MSAPTLFDGQRLTLARQLGGVRKSELASILGKSSTIISAWESGAKRPLPANVAALAMALGVSPTFFAPRGAQLTAAGTVPHFRSLRSTSQKARDQAFAYGLLAADIASAIEKHVEFPDVAVTSIPVAPDDEEDAPQRAARQMRANWGVANGPMPHLIRLLENHGILVIFSHEQSSAVDAYSFDTVTRPVIVLNPVKNDYYRQRFDVAHELGHLVMHDDSEPGSRVVEEQAHRFAAELLMPEDELRELLPTAMNAKAWDRLGALKEEWGVSIQALLYRARSLGRIGDVTYRNAMVTLTQRGWRRSEPGRVTTIEQPSMLPRSVQLLGEAGISEDTLALQCSAPSSLFHRVVARTPVVEAPEPDAVVTREVVSLLPRITERDTNKEERP